MHLYKCNGVADLLKHALPMCHRAEIGRSPLKGVGINTGNLQNCGALELRSLGVRGVADTPHRPPHVTTSNLVVL